ADIANTYFLSTNSDWAFFDQSMISLAKKQATGVNVTLYPAAVPEGLYNITLRSVSDRGQLPIEKSVDVSVENCYSISLTVDAAPQLVSCEQYIVNGHAQNDGTRESSYSFGLYGASWASLSTPIAVVKAGEIKDIPVMINVPCNETGVFDYILTANVTNFPEKMAQAIFPVEVISIEEAYSIELDSVEEKIEVNYDGGESQITITSFGIRDSDYDVILTTDQDWIKLDKTKISLPAGSSETITLIFTPTNETEEGTYDISVTVVPKGKDIGYERQFSIKLRQKTLGEKILGALPYVIAAVLLLVLVVLAILLISRKGKEEKEWKEIEGEPSRIIHEEKADKLIEVEKKEKGWLKWLLIILALLILLGGIGAGVYFLTSFFTADDMNATNETIEEPIIEEPVINETIMNETQGPGLLSRMWGWIFKEKNETAVIEEPAEPEPSDHNLLESATIYVNRTGLRGYGDVIEIKGYENITIPLVIQNNYEPNTFKIRVNEEVDWIQVDKENVVIPPNGRETVNIIITPDAQVEEGNYKIDIRIDVEGRTTPISEEIVLKVSQDKPFYLRYLWYILAGIIVLLVLAIIAGAREWGKKKDDLELEPVKEKEIKKKAKVEPTTSEESKKDYSWLKYMLLGMIIILILAGIIFGVIYAMKSFAPVYSDNLTEENQTKESTTPEILEKPQEVPVEEITEPEIEYEEVFVKKTEDTLIPLVIRNANETATFQIKINEDIDWITVSASEVEIGPNEKETVNLIASPDENVEDGSYKVTVNIEVNGQEKQFTQGFILQVNKSQFSALWTYLLYALAGIIILAAILALLNQMEKKGVEEQQPEEQPKKQKKKKTDIKLK
ncbi:MAG: hypothetical protein KKE20_01815, partial [Nanoarchaeota archaeon]|nr:hypothetical protein [Nanoarchaeota archaeon]